jgi:large subunit ribosomal protein L22
MITTAKLKYLHIAPRKVRLIADLVRGKTVEQALSILNFTVKRASNPVLKLLKSAVANAKNNFQIEENNLYISKIVVDGGPVSKRWRARSRGRAFEILKRTSHIIIELDKIKKSAKKRATTSEIQRKKPKIAKIKTKIEKPKFEIHKPSHTEGQTKMERGLKRVFRRKAF